MRFETFLEVRRIVNLELSWQFLHGFHKISLPSTSLYFLRFTIYNSKFISIYIQFPYAVMVLYDTSCLVLLETICVTQCLLYILFSTKRDKADNLCSCIPESRSTHAFQVYSVFLCPKKIPFRFWRFISTFKIQVWRRFLVFIKCFYFNAFHWSC